MEGEIAMERYWTTKQVAERLCVSTDCVKKWMSSGKLARTKFGGMTRISETDLQDFRRRSTDKTPMAA
jgi:excisionase family DNA binding protein